MKATLAMMIAIGATNLAAQQPDIGPAPGRLVDIGGRRLHLLCSGAGSPTVILEAGASAFAIDWTLVQREIARTNRVCSHDRAGSGWSDSSTATTRASVAHDLHTLLEVAGERPPFVLAGASLGGIFVRLYEAEYPDQIVGMVLVDPASEDRLFAMLGNEAVLIASLTPEQLRTTIPQRTVRVPRRPPQTGVPFDRLPAELYQVRIRLDERLIASQPDSVTPEQMLAYQEGERARLARLRALRAANEHPLGAKPLVVLSRGVDGSEGQRDSHAALASLSTRSRHEVVAGSGHEIHLFQPAAVIRAIADVIAVATSARNSL
jgi:pimeloyl-ACP methyl ester carboxylesterase